MKQVSLRYVIQENHFFTLQKLSLDSHLSVCIFKCDIYGLLFDADFKILASSAFAWHTFPSVGIDLAIDVV